MRTGLARVTLFDDFLLTSAPGWTGNSDVGGTTAILANTEDGFYNLTTAATSGNRAQVVGERVWRAESGGPLVFECGLRIPTAVTNRGAFVGFTDVTTLEMPIEASGTGDGITTNASDAVGFMYDTNASTDVWFVVGVDSDTDAPGSGPLAARWSDRTPVAGTDYAFRFTVNEDGQAEFWINGQAVNRGSDINGWSFNRFLNSAVSTNVNLAPTVVAITRAAAAASVYVDYIYCQKGRNP